MICVSLSDYTFYKYSTHEVRMSMVILRHFRLRNFAETTSELFRDENSPSENASRVQPPAATHDWARTPPHGVRRHERRHTYGVSTSSHHVGSAFREQGESLDSY